MIPEILRKGGAPLTLARSNERSRFILGATEKDHGASKSIRKRSEQMINSMKPMRVALGMSQSLCIALLLLTGCALSAQNLFAQSFFARKTSRSEYCFGSRRLGGG